MPLVQIEITRKDATELITEMAAGTLSAEETTLAFGLRAGIAHQLVRWTDKLHAGRGRSMLILLCFCGGLGTQGVLLDGYMA